MTDKISDKADELIRVSHKYKHLKVEKIFKELSKGKLVALRMIDKLNGDKADIAECIQVGDICRDLQCTPAAVSKMLKNLESKGWIVREVNKNNRRNTNVILTEEGRKITYEAHKKMRDFTMRIYQRLGTDKMNTLIEILEETYDIAEDEIIRMEAGK